MADLDQDTSNGQPLTHANTRYEPTAEVLADAADTFALLASSQRLHLLWLLSNQERDVSTLAETLGASVPLVSQHLAKLRLAGLVSARREGKRQLYSVDDPHVLSFVEQAIDHHEDLRTRTNTRWTGHHQEQR